MLWCRKLKLGILFGGVGLQHHSVTLICPFHNDLEIQKLAWAVSWKLYGSSLYSLGTLFGGCRYATPCDLDLTLA